MQKIILRLSSFAVVIMLTTLVAACTSEPYETGDGEYSYLRTDFAVVSTNGSANIASFLTDEGREMTLATPFEVEKLKADTTYRALVYYSQPLNADLEVMSVRLVNVCNPFKPSKEQIMKTDPIGWESIWVSENKSYLNLALNLMVGVSDDEDADKQQVLGVRLDSSEDHQTHYTLYHDQNNVPEYYTYKTYVSIPLGKDAQSGDAYTVTVNTYDGILQKTVYLP